MLGFLTGAVALAHSQVVIRARGRRLDPVLLAGVQTAVGGTVLMTIGGLVEQPLETAVWSVRAFLALGYLSLFGTVLGFTLLYWLLRRMQVTRVNSMMLVHPMIAMILGAVILGERLSWLVLLGAVAIVGGLVAMLRPGRQPAPEILVTGEYSVEG
jgi:drug/metabolite transporter (DMT)-like permease